VRVYRYTARDEIPDTVSLQRADDRFQGGKPHEANRTLASRLSAG
jgi:hypothetical protein